MKKFTALLVTLVCCMSFAAQADAAWKEGENDYQVHIRKWYEDIELIARQYGVTPEAIMSFNKLTDSRLKNRQKLLIPSPDYVPPVSSEPAVQHSPAAGKGEESGEVIMEAGGKNSVNALLLLPFGAQTPKPNSSFMEFYCGALMAVRDLGNEGLNVDLSVYDTYGSILPVTESRLETSDFVIGPIDGNALGGLLYKAPGKLAVVSPLDTQTDSLALRHRNFIQAPTSALHQYEDLISWIKSERAPQDSVVVIYEKNFRNGAKKATFSKMLADSSLQHSTFSYNILEGRDILDSLSRQLSLEGDNRILVASESEAFTNDVIRNLNLLIHNKYRITLYGASKIRNFETIDVDNLHNTNFHTSLSYYIDYDEPEVRDFLMKFRALYGAEPSLMAFQGYDIMYYFAKMRAKYGEGWMQMMQDERMEMLMSDFSFEQKGEGLVKNTIRRVIYGPGYSVSLLR